MLDQPAVVLLAVALGALLLVLEAALPTGGLAGAVAAVAIAAAAWGVASDESDWWPLLLVAAAIALWAALVALRRSTAAGLALAALLYLGGAAGFAVANDDLPALAVAIVSGVALPLAFPRLSRASDRLVDLPAQTGMESLEGRLVEVLDWDAGAGTVRLDGSLWQARGPTTLLPGTEVVVVGSERTTLIVGATMAA